MCSHSRQNKHIAVGNKHKPKAFLWHLSNAVSRRQEFNLKQKILYEWVYCLKQNNKIVNGTLLQLPQEGYILPEVLAESRTAFGNGKLPSSSQKEKPQSHVVSQVESIVHLSSRLLVHETAKLKDFQVSRASHHHCKREQQDTQACFKIIVTCLHVE